MHFQWFKTEHHRLHTIEEWPDSPHKEAALAATRSKLASLARNLPNSHPLHCELCLNREPGAARFLIVPACRRESV